MLAVGPGWLSQPDTGTRPGQGKPRRSPAARLAAGMVAKAALALPAWGDGDPGKQIPSCRPTPQGFALVL